MITSRWAINEIPIYGPNSVDYGVTTAVARRMDKVPIRQGDSSMQWSFDALPVDQYAIIYSAWETGYQQAGRGKVAVTCLDRFGNWNEHQRWTLYPPQIGKRSGFMIYGITLFFRVGFGIRWTTLPNFGEDPPEITYG